jgi:hypothetical protein
VVIVLIVTLIVFYTSFPATTPKGRDVVEFPAAAHTASNAQPVTMSSHVDESIYQVQNETLGFQEIYMISLPGRTDKQDAFAMQAAFSDISYTQMDGVYGHEVPAKALPHVRAADGINSFIQLANYIADDGPGG